MTLGRVLADDSLRADVFSQLRSGLWSPDGQAAPELLLAGLDALRMADLLRAFDENAHVIDRIGRPMILIEKGTFELPAVDRWRRPLEASQPVLERASAAVGRLEVVGLKGFAGTGWIVDVPGHQGIVVTNRHVVLENFGTLVDGRAQFLAVGNAHLEVALALPSGGEGRPARSIRVEAILHVDRNVDLAVLRLEPTADLPTAIALGSGALGGEDMAVIGFPSDDPDDWQDNALLDEMGQSTLSPGTVIAPDGNRFSHDASTTPGSSGSPVLDMAGQAMGVHYRGSDPDARMRTNFAVAFSPLQECLATALGL